MKRHQMIQFTRLLVLAVGVECSIVPTVAQAPSAQERQRLIEQSVADTERSIGVIRPVLFRDLTPGERAIYAHIQFKVSKEDSGWLAGGTVTELGDRFVTLDEGYIRSIQMIADSLLLEQRLGKEFLPQYISYVSVQLRNKATFISAPYAFIGMSPADIDALDQDKDFSLQRNMIVANSTAFILAHEVGHHVLGHYDHPLPSSDIEGAQRREMEADQWAVRQMVKAHLSPLGGVSPILFDFYMSPFMSPDSGHPAPIQRVRQLFSAMEDALPEFRADVEAQGQSYETFRGGITAQLADLERRIESTPDLNWKNNQADPFCTAVTNVVAGGKSRFRSISTSSSGNGESFDAPILVPGAHECTVWHYRDRSLGDSVVCVLGRTSTMEDLIGPFDQVSSALKGCLKNWSVRNLQGGQEKQTTLRNTDDDDLAVRLRLSYARRDGTYLLSLWFDHD